MNMTKVLLIEDDADIVENLTAYLREEGFQVKASDGQAKALQMLEKDKFELVLLDVTLAEGNGYSACTAIKAKYEIPVIFLTALGDEFSEGSPIVIINDIRFQSRRGIDWNKVEKYLKEYIGKYFEITETSEKIYIGSDFPDEFSHSNDTKRLKGANTKAKANMTSAIGELIQIATEKAQYPDYNNKHGEKAKLGWYRYNTKFGIPVYDADGKLYLYDLVRTKKETSEPHEQ